MKNIERIFNIILICGLVCSFWVMPAKTVSAQINDEVVFINEIHYDNEGTDTGERVEIAGPGGTDLTGWTLVLYSSSDGAVYDTILLPDRIPFTPTGYGTVVVETPGLQNGSPDGLALVKADSSVSMFLSYEGSFSAVNGPAAGLTSTNIGVTEDGSDPAGKSLQLSGLGKTYNNFTWQSALDETFGTPNTNQYFGEIFINEVNYDSLEDLDHQKGFEVAGPAGVSLAGWKIMLYDASNRTVSYIISLSGTLPDQENGFGTLYFFFSQLSRLGTGAALVNPQNKVVQFISWYAVFTALTGPAAGMTSERLPYLDTTSSVEQSVQLAGSGIQYSDFEWPPCSPITVGQINNNQSFGIIINTSPIADDQALSTAEDTPVDITLSASDINEDNLTYHLVQEPQYGTLTHDTSNAWIYAPDADYFGDDLFTFTANDGSDDSNPATVSLTITPINDQPGFTAGENQSVPEDSPETTITAWAGDISPGAENENDQSLSFTLTLTSGSDLFSTAPAIDPATGDLTFTPAADKNGTAEIEVLLMDDGGQENGGVDTSDTHTLTIEITAVNDAPSFTPGEDVEILEDAATQILSTWASDLNPGPADEAGQELIFDLTITSGSDLFTTTPAINPSTGNLTFTPAADKNGTAEIEVLLTDDGGEENGGEDTSASHTLTIEIIAVNDAPSFTPGQDVEILEDAAAQTISAWASDLNPGPVDEAGQELSFDLNLLSGSDLFSTAPTIDPDTGDLNFIPAADQFGTAEVTVQLFDDGETANGGTNSSLQHTLTIEITPVNDAPDFTPGTQITVEEDISAFSQTNWATGIIPGPENENDQTLTFTLTADNPDLFLVQPALSQDGTLSFEPATDAYGSTQVNITLQDDGGTDNNGSDSSQEHTLNIEITPVNDPPFFTPGEDISVEEDSGLQTILGWATNINPGAANEADQTLTFVVETSSGAELFSTLPQIDPITGNLSFTPAENAFGEAFFEVSLQDDGEGENSSTAHSLKISITPVNDAPAAQAQSLTLDENSSLVFTLTGSDPEGDTLSYEITVLPQHGNLEDVEGGFRYTPFPDFNGVDSLTFIASDGEYSSDPAVIEITINPVNDRPIAEAESYTIPFNTDLSIQAPGVLENDSDPDGDSLTSVLFAAPAHGSVGLNPDGSFTYQPQTGFSGEDTFTYRAFDGELYSETIIVTITVEPGIPITSGVKIFLPLITR